MNKQEFETLRDAAAEHLVASERALFTVGADFAYELMRERCIAEGRRLEMERIIAILRGDKARDEIPNKSMFMTAGMACADWIENEGAK
jgi:hypothetical protein